MCEANFPENFKRDTVAQIADRGYPVRQIVARLQGSNRSIDRRQKQFSPPETVIKEAHASANAIRC
jgi:transposase-like protein